jgi:hypothetical protein
MATEATAPEAVEPEVEGERERSTIKFPYADLDNAVRIAKGVHQVAGMACQEEQLAAQLGVAVKGGAFRMMLYAAKIFGLVGLSQGSVRLTALGQRVNDPQQEKMARAEAFLTVPLYGAIYQQYKGGTLPPAAALESEMVNLGVAKKVTEKARQVFQRAAMQAGFFAFGQDRLVLPASGPGGAVQQPKHEEPESKGREEHERKGGGGGTGGGGRDHLIEGLINKLPDEGTEWGIEDRQRWLQLAAGIFEFVYKNKDANGNSKVLKIELSAK